ncbi:MAG: SET domain-containing protein-lysine N-methyltransferase [Ferruginibacter sp.]|nr:SET domain-containing protein-lysine N-methyltransferase [Ferruginibacter sp.]
MLYHSLYIDNTTQKGRGVFTNAAIEKDTLIEIAPVIIMPAADREHLDKTLLHDYIFEWGTDGKHCCMALGYVPIYNHSYKSNCIYIMDYDENNIWIKTVTQIEAGEELTINYNGDWDDEKKVWFDVV